MPEIPGWVWWYTSIIPALRRLSLEDHEVQDSLDYILRLCHKKEKKKKENQLINQTKKNPKHKQKPITYVFCISSLPMLMLVVPSEHVHNFRVKAIKTTIIAAEHSAKYRACEAGSAHIELLHFMIL
jgi:hypothetical protein